MRDKAVEKALAALRAISKPEPAQAALQEPGEAFEPAAPCGSPHCAGCYEIEPGRRIHPPKPSKEWLEWLARWQPGQKGRKQ